MMNCSPATLRATQRPEAAALSLAGYASARVLRSSAGVQVHELRRAEPDSQPAVARVYVAHDEQDQLFEAEVVHALELIAAVEVEGLARPLVVERVGELLVVVHEVAPGVSLASAGGGMSVATVCTIALGLTRILVGLHAHGLLHLDIKPSSVSFDERTAKVYLTDVGVPALLERERSELDDPALIQATLGCVAPEQLSRIRRDVDARTDLYSLGAILYLLLAGALPFPATSVAEIVDAQLASTPRPLHGRVGDRVAGLPKLLAEIVAKLLEKAPQRRYQTARGLLDDLQRLIDARASGDADPSFELGATDRASTLLRPAKLYGRESDARILAIELGRVREHRDRRLMIVHGDAGIGKTALLESFEAVVAGASGCFMFGRHHPQATRHGHGQLGGPTGLSGLSGALASVAARLSIAPEHERASWRAHLVAEVGPLLAHVTALVPGFEQIVGRPPVEQLAIDRARDAGQAGHALELALSRLIRALERIGTPVLVLDDLQRADARSVELLRALLLDQAQTPLLIVVACTDLALEAEAPLARLITELVGCGRAPGFVPLERPRRAGLEQLLAELLGHSANEPSEQPALDALANFVIDRVGSNPRAIRLCLSELVERELLQLRERGWAWDPAAIAQLPGNFGCARGESLSDFDEREQALLARAACLDPRFFAGELASLCELSLPTLAAALHELERRRVLVRVGRELSFRRPSLRVLAREQLAPRERARVHAMIAEQQLARHGSVAQLGRRVFALVDHLLCAVPDVQGDERLGQLGAAQRSELLELSAAAGAHAVMLGARDTACAYLEFAVELASLGAGVTVGEAELALAHASVLAWCRRDADADAAFDQLLARALPIQARGRVVVAAIRSLAARGRSDVALELGLAGLARCDAEATGGSGGSLGAALGIGDRPPSEVASLARSLLASPCTHLDVRRPRPDARKPGPEYGVAHLDAAMLILTALERALIVGNFESFARLACAHFELVATHGLHHTAPIAFAYFGLVLAVELGDAAHGAQLCERALELCACVEGEPELRLLVEGVASLRVWPLCRPPRDCRARAPALLRETVELGALELAGAIASAGAGFGFACAPELAELTELVTRGRQWVARLDDRGAIDLRVGFDSWIRVINHLEGHLDSRADPFAGRGPAASGWITATDLEHASPATVVSVWIHQSLAQWLLGEREAARASVSVFVDVYESALGGGCWALALGAVMEAILACDACDACDACETSDDAPEQRRALAQLDHARALAQQFGAHGWTNFQACVQLVEAEHARARGQVDEAFAGYERACDLAEEIHSACVQALASERLISFARAQRRRATARGATLTAIAWARRWGAWRVAVQLERGHADLLSDLRSNLRSDLGPLARVEQPQQPRPGPASAPGDGRVEVDAVLLVGMLFLIGEDLDFDEVIARVLETSLATSDAQASVLVLERDGQLCEVARLNRGSVLAQVDDPVPLANLGEQLPVTVIEHVMRTEQPLVVDDASVDPRFANDPYVQLTRARSLLCLPISGAGEQIGALLLEHRLIAGMFMPAGLQSLRALASQAGATLSHARVHEALRRSEALFQTVVSGAPDMIALLDRQGRIEFINHLGGFPADTSQFVGVEAAFLMGPSAAPRFRNAVAAALETGEPQELEVKLELPDGEVRWYEVRLGPAELGDRHGKLLSFSTDVTARKHAQAERLSLEAQLRQQQRLESVGTLASGVAHEINNPIQGIMNYAELIAGRTDDVALVEEFAQEILIESDRVATIVRNLLAFSRQDVDEPPELQSVEDLVASTLSLFRAVVTRDGIVLTVDTPAGLARVRCRPQQIQQVIMNLVANARDAVRSLHPNPKDAPAGANHISISARAVETDVGAVVRLSVADRGGGVPEHVRARIFDPFFTTKGRDQGTGLGLAVSHGIARDHGGELWFETVAGDGSVFHLDLPVDAS
jgi:PAS domain S-box-containing protein